MKTFNTVLEEHQKVMSQLQAETSKIEAAAKLLVDTLRFGGKIMFCGNGGSAADSQHLAAELVVRYERHRQGLAAIALTTDSSILTAHANDYGFDTVFARQVEALGAEKDCLVALSTSGESKNILLAVEAANQKGIAVIALTGGTGGQLRKLAGISIVVPSAVTARVQEAHILIGHWWCGQLEEVLGVSDNP